MSTQDKNIARRAFLAKLGKGAAVSVSAAALPGILTGCGNKGIAHVPGASSVEAGESGGNMTYRTNPKTGEKVSILGYGCMRWPMMKNPDGDGDIIDQESVNSLVDYAIAHGVNYFDTAPPYVRGLSERATGIALSRHPRNSYFLATKMSNQSFSRGDVTPEEIYRESVKMYRNSQKELQTDYFDYYLCHNVGGGDGIPFVKKRFFDSKVIDFLLQEREKGNIRNLGFSYHGDIKVFDYMLSRHDEIKWDFVQIQLNYVDYRHASGSNFNAEYLYSELEKRSIPVVIMEPLLGGRLATLTDYLNNRLKVRKPQDSIASWAFRFAGSFPDVLCVLSGMTYMEHLQDNIKTYSPLEPCSEEELELLEDTAKIMIQYPTVPCTTCEYCMPCPYGINIPGIFLHYNKCINEGNVSSSYNDENYARARKAFLVGYDRSIPKLRQASHCINCGECEPHCPQRIKIPHELRKIDRYVEQLKQGTLGEK